MGKEKIPIAGDHMAYDLKSHIIEYLIRKGIDPIDLGTYSKQRVDYPLYSKAVAEKISQGKFERGIVLCGSGIGVSIAANKFPGVRAALVHDIQSAKMTKKHNNPNIICLGAGVLDSEKAIQIIETWLEEEFDGGRHQNRLEQINSYENNISNTDNYRVPFGNNFFKKEKDVMISASLMCANQMNIEADVSSLIEAGIDMFHIDIIDGNFAPNISLNPAHVSSLRNLTTLPIDVHLMVKKPSNYIDALSDNGADIVIIHFESEDDISEVISSIKNKNMKSGLALEIDTPIEEVFDYLSEIDYLMFMSVKTGFASQPFETKVIDNINKISTEIRNRNLTLTLIADGSVGPRTIPHFYENGVRIFVGGTSGLFKEGSFEDNIIEMKSYCT